MLHDLVRRSAARLPAATAVVGPDAVLTFAELDARADAAAHALAAIGVGPGTRVGLWLDKSTATVAALQGVLRTGAAYVPLDPANPAGRVAAITADCALHAVVTTAVGVERLRQLGVRGARLFDIDELTTSTGTAFPSPLLSPSDPAYILYTSGSTGTPKGVCISHAAALAFVDWAVAEMQLTETDRLANHAPFNFDLSVLDLYGAFAVGAACVLVPDALAYAPEQLVTFIRENEITVWYSVPTVLVLMIEHGTLLEQPDLPLRLVNFAGEPFPIRYLARLVERWPPPRMRYLNLYGPTETNVCTFYEVTPDDAHRTTPVPIGSACCGDLVWAEKPDGSRAAVGEEGELVVTGPTVLLGYWGHPPHGDRPYRTGDRVLHVAPDVYEYRGRFDHMVKLRGHRIEPGEVEAALALHPAIREVAAVVAGEGVAARLVAFIAPVAAGRTPHLLELKQHCAERLPRPMIIDRVIEIDALQRTRTGKIDRARLAALAEQMRVTQRNGGG